MTLDKARELIQVRLGLSGGYDHNVVRPILDDIQREHSRQAMDGSMRPLKPIFGQAPGTNFGDTGQLS